MCLNSPSSVSRERREVAGKLFQGRRPATVMGRVRVHGTKQMFTSADRRRRRNLFGSMPLADCSIICGFIRTIATGSSTNKTNNLEITRSRQEHFCFKLRSNLLLARYKKLENCEFVRLYMLEHSRRPKSSYLSFLFVALHVVVK